MGSADEAEDGDPKQLLKTFQDDVPDSFANQAPRRHDRRALALGPAAFSSQCQAARGELASKLGSLHCGGRALLSDTQVALGGGVGREQTTP